MLRTFFRDLQEWEMIPRRFDPIRSFVTPKSVLAKIGPNPRIIRHQPIIVSYFVFMFVGHLESAFFSSLISFSVSSNFRMICWSPFIAARVVHGYLWSDSESCSMSPSSP